MSDFDKAAADWDKNKMHIERSEAIAKKIIPLLEGKKFDDALEFGAGTGLLSFELKDRFKNILLLDSSQEMVNTANAKIAQNGAKHMKAEFFDLEKTDYTTSTFDVIFNQMVLHHVENIDLIFEKFHRLLNTNGMLAIADLYTEDGTFHHEGFNGHRGFDPAALEAKLQSTGFINPSHQTCFTITKEVWDGNVRNFPVFLLVAYKK